jgi:hypothetical protein
MTLPQPDLGHGDHTDIINTPAVQLNEAHIIGSHKRGIWAHIPSGEYYTDFWQSCQVRNSIFSQFRTCQIRFVGKQNRTDLLADKKVPTGNKSRSERNTL